MLENNHISAKKFYAYSFDEQNQVYLVRGLDHNRYYGAAIKEVPDGLIEDLVFEEYIKHNRIVEVKNKKAIISYSKDRFCALVDFNGRHFTEEQVLDVVSGRRIKNPPVADESTTKYTYVEEQKKSFTKRLKRGLDRDIDNN